MRHKPYARPELTAWEACIDEPALLRGKWSTAFALSLPLRVEMGCGKGGFLAGQALRQPACNYLGVDIKSEMLVVAKRTIEWRFAEAGKQPDNVLLTAYNIEKLEKILAPEDVAQRSYINFCNPWYKSGYAKHRLTHPRQLIKYRNFLQDGGSIYFKTDDTPLFEDSLRYFALAGFEVTWLSRNLHAEEPAWNVRTEHEQMFANEGLAINTCLAVKKAIELDFDMLSRLKTV
jgi:tRNA (guanine-N7-)-methyltransferase